MKLLGEKSLSKYIKIFLIILSIICFLCILLGGFYILTFWKTIFILPIAIPILLIYFTGILALILLVQFIGIFHCFEEGKLFVTENVSRLKISYICSFSIFSIYTISIIYFIYLMHDSMALYLFILPTITLFIIDFVFLIFAIGLVILTELYKKSIKYKEENDLTI